MSNPATQSESASGKRLPAWAVAVLLGAITVAVYWPATGFQFVDYDDPAIITGNPHVCGGLTSASFKWAWIGEVNGNWHPITTLSLMLDCQLSGVKPWWPHLLNVLLHAANAVLLLALFKRMTGALWRSAIVAAFFALHPLHVESVAWVSERKDVLSTLFWFLTLWAYVRYAENRKAQVSNLKLHYGLSLLFFALGLMSKPMLVTVPFTLLLLDYWPLGRMKEGWRLVTEKMPHFALSAAMCVVTFRIQKQSGAVVRLEQLPLSQRTGNALMSYIRYMEKLFWPSHLAGLYPMTKTSWPWWTLAALALAGVSTGILTQWRRRPWLAVGWCWFVGTLVPVIGLVQVGGQAMADRYTYVPLTGLFVILAWGGWELTSAWKMPWIATLLTACALGICTGLTVHQEYYWRDSETLYKRMIEVTHDIFMAHNNLGHVLDEKGRNSEAIREFTESIRLNPGFAEAHNNLGAALGRKGRLDDAIREYQEAIRLKPDFAGGHNNLGAALYERGRVDEAIRQYQAVVQLEPDYADAYSNLGLAFRSKGQTDEAIRQFRQAIRLKPDAALFHYNLGLALDAKGQTSEAIEQFRQAIRQTAEFVEARNDLGAILEREGQADEAISQFREVIRLRQDSPHAYFILAGALARKGRIEEAISQYQEAIRLNPAYVEAHNNLGTIFQRQGRFDDAAGQYRQTIQLKPDSAETHYNLGMLLKNQGQLDEAIKQYQEAIRLKPDFALACCDLGLVLQSKSRTDEAIKEYLVAIRLAPQYAEAHNNLGVVLGQKGRLDEAILQFQEAVRLKPDYAEARANLDRALQMKGVPATR